jgi:hypothetical protein
LRYLYATREEMFFHGTRQALLNHTERMLQLEREYASRFPERTKADGLRTGKGSRIQAGQPTGRQARARPGPAARAGRPPPPAHLCRDAGRARESPTLPGSHIWPSALGPSSLTSRVPPKIGMGYYNIYR